MVISDFKKVIAVLTTFLFIYTSINFNSDLYAQPVAISLPVLDIQKITVNGSAASLEERFRGTEGPRGRTVIAVQDAHGIFDAQENIRVIIQELQDQYGFELVGLEGGVGKADHTFLRTFPDKEINAEQARKYMKRAELSGGEAAAILNPKPGIFYGIENRDLYFQNRNSFIKALELKDFNLHEIDLMEKKLDKTRSKIFPEKLIAFHRAAQNFHRGRMSLLDFATILQSESAAVAVNVGQYPNVLRLFEAIAKARKGGNKEAVAKEVQEVTTKIEGRVLFEEIDKLINEINLSLSSRTSTEGEARRRDPGSSVVTELLTQFHELQILRNLVSLQLTRKEYEEFVGAGLVPARGRPQGSPLQNLQLAPAETFYRDAVKRDQALYDNFIAAMNHEKKDRAIIVTGGFHEEGLRDRLRKENISYVFYMPRIQTITPQDDYYRVMSGKVSYNNKKGRTSSIQAILATMGLDPKLEKEFNQAYAVGGLRALAKKVGSAGGIQPYAKIWQDAIIKTIKERGETLRDPSDLIALVKNAVQLATGKADVEEMLNQLEQSFNETLSGEARTRVDQFIDNLRKNNLNVEKALVVQGRSLGATPENEIRKIGREFDRWMGEDKPEVNPELFPEYVHLAFQTGQEQLARERLVRMLGHLVLQPQAAEALRELNRRQSRQYVFRGEITESTSLLGHENRVRANISTDGTKIVSAGADATVRVWDVSTNRQLAGAQFMANSVNFSPDGTKIVAAGNEGTVHVRDMKINSLARLGGHEDWVNSANFSPDGTKIVSVGSDRFVRVWDVRTGRKLVVLPRSQIVGVSSVNFSPDGTKIISAHFDGMVRVWDARTGNELVLLRGHVGRVNSANFSPDGTKIVSAGDDGTVRVWDTRTGNELVELHGHEGMVFSANFSADGTRIVSAGDGTVRVWDVRTGYALAVLRGPQNWVLSANFSADGTKIVSAGEDGIVRIWQARHRNEIPVPENAPDFSGMENQISGWMRQSTNATLLAEEAQRSEARTALAAEIRQAAANALPKDKEIPDAQLFDLVFDWADAHNIEPAPVTAASLGAGDTTIRKINRISREIAFLTTGTRYIPEEYRDFKNVAIIEGATRAGFMGDVQGNFTEMKEAMVKGGFINSKGDWTGGTAVFGFAGDLVDSGPESAQVLDFIMKLTEQAKQAGGRVIAIHGNHDDMMLQALDELKDVKDSELSAGLIQVAGPLWWTQGGKETAVSFLKYAGIEVPEKDKDIFIAYRNYMNSPAGIKFLDFLKDLPYAARVNNVLLIHGGPDFEARNIRELAADPRSQKVVTWARHWEGSEELDKFKENMGVDFIVYGHTQKGPAIAGRQHAADIHYQDQGLFAINVLPRASTGIEAHAVLNFDDRGIQLIHGKEKVGAEYLNKVIGEVDELEKDRKRKLEELRETLSDIESKASEIGEAAEEEIPTEATFSFGGGKQVIDLPEAPDILIAESDRRVLARSLTNEEKGMMNVMARAAAYEFLGLKERDAKFASTYLKYRQTQNGVFSKLHPDNIKWFLSAYGDLSPEQLSERFSALMSGGFQLPVDDPSISDQIKYYFPHVLSLSRKVRQFKTLAQKPVKSDSGSFTTSQFFRKSGLDQIEKGFAQVMVNLGVTPDQFYEYMRLMNLTDEFEHLSFDRSFDRRDDDAIAEAIDNIVVAAKLNQVDVLDKNSMNRIHQALINFSSQSQPDMTESILRARARAEAEILGKDPLLTSGGIFGVRDSANPNRVFVPLEIARLSEEPMDPDISGMTTRSLNALRNGHILTDSFGMRGPSFMENNMGETITGGISITDKEYQASLAYQSSFGIPAISENNAKLHFDSLKKHLNEFGIKLDEEFSPKSGGNYLLINRILSLIPEKLKNSPSLRIIELNASRVQAARGSAYDDETARVAIYPWAMEHSDRRLFVALMIHEIGHSIQGALPDKEMEVMGRAHSVLGHNKAFIHTEYFMPDRASYQYSYPEFFAEMNLIYISRGDYLRNLIKTHPNYKVREAYQKVYDIYRALHGREYSESQAINQLDEQTAQLADVSVEEVRRVKKTAEIEEVLSDDTPALGSPASISVPEGPFLGVRSNISAYDVRQKLGEENLEAIKNLFSEMMMGQHPTLIRIFQNKRELMLERAVNYSSDELRNKIEISRRNEKLGNADGEAVEVLQYALRLREEYPEIMDAVNRLIRGEYEESQRFRATRPLTFSRGEIGGIVLGPVEVSPINILFESVPGDPSLLKLTTALQPGSNTYYLKAGEEVMAGRSSDAGIRVLDQKISRKHVRIALSEDGQKITIEDLASTSGTHYQINTGTMIADMIKVRKPAGKILPRPLGLPEISPVLPPHPPVFVPSRKVETIDFNKMFLDLQNRESAIREKKLERLKDSSPEAKAEVEAYLAALQEIVIARPRQPEEQGAELEQFLTFIGDIQWSDKNRAEVNRLRDEVLKTPWVAEWIEVYDKRIRQQIAYFTAANQIPDDKIILNKNTLSVLVNLSGFKNISDLSALSRIKNLKTLYIVETNVSDLNPLIANKNLEKLYTRGSQVTPESISTFKEAHPNKANLRVVTGASLGAAGQAHSFSDVDMVMLSPVGGYGFKIDAIGTAGGDNRVYFRIYFGPRAEDILAFNPDTDELERVYPAEGVRWQENLESAVAELRSRGINVEIESNAAGEVANLNITMGPALLSERQGTSPTIPEPATDEDEIAPLSDGDLAALPEPVHAVVEAPQPGIQELGFWARMQNRFLKFVASRRAVGLDKVGDKELAQIAGTSASTNGANLVREVTRLFYRYAGNFFHPRNQTRLLAIFSNLNTLPLRQQLLINFQNSFRDEAGTTENPGLKLYKQFLEKLKENPNLGLTQDAGEYMSYLSNPKAKKRIVLGGKEPDVRGASLGTAATIPELDYSPTLALEEAREILKGERQVKHSVAAEILGLALRHADEIEKPRFTQELLKVERETESLYSRISGVLMSFWLVPVLGLPAVIYIFYTGLEIRNFQIWVREWDDNAVVGTGAMTASFVFLYLFSEIWKWLYSMDVHKQFMSAFRTHPGFFTKNSEWAWQQYQRIKYPPFLVWLMPLITKTKTMLIDDLMDEYEKPVYQKSIYRQEIQSFSRFLERIREEEKNSGIQEYAETRRQELIQFDLKFEALAATPGLSLSREKLDQLSATAPDRISAKDWLQVIQLFVDRGVPREAVRVYHQGLKDRSSIHLTQQVLNVYGVRDMGEMIRLLTAPGNKFVLDSKEPMSQQSDQALTLLEQILPPARGASLGIYPGTPKYIFNARLNSALDSLREGNRKPAERLIQHLHSPGYLGDALEELSKLALEKYPAANAVIENVAVNPDMTFFEKIRYFFDTFEWRVKKYSATQQERARAVLENLPLYQERVPEIQNALVALNASLKDGSKTEQIQAAERLHQSLRKPYSVPLNTRLQISNELITESMKSLRRVFSTLTEEEIVEYNLKVLPVDPQDAAWSRLRGNDENFKNEISGILDRSSGVLLVAGDLQQKQSLLNNLRQGIVTFEWEAVRNFYYFPSPESADDKADSILRRMESKLNNNWIRLEYRKRYGFPISEMFASGQSKPVPMALGGPSTKAWIVPEARGKFSLKITDKNGNEVNAAPLTGNRLFAGRGMIPPEDSEGVIDLSVSQEHFVINLNGDEIEILDESKNGTWIQLPEAMIRRLDTYKTRFSPMLLDNQGWDAELAVSSEAGMPSSDAGMSSSSADGSVSGASLGVNDKGLCVTGDTLLPINERLIPIKDVHPGDEVLSLNEATQKIEPRRINALLDMGVKPVYKLTTASGRSIKTTANHPYLVMSDGKSDWVKVSELEVGNKIACPSSIEWRAGPNGNDGVFFHPAHPGFSKSELQIRVSWLLSSIPWLLSLCFSFSWAKNYAKYNKDKKENPDTHTAPNRQLSKQGISHSRSKNGFCQISQNFSDKFFSTMSGTFHGAELSSKFNNNQQKYDYFIKRAYAADEQISDVFWDTIVAIEPLGLEHVYDIEVDGTHNFIGNGIFAHNTYTQAVQGASLGRGDEGIRAAERELQLAGAREGLGTGLRSWYQKQLRAAGVISLEEIQDLLTRYTRPDQNEEAQQTARELLRDLARHDQALGPEARLERLRIRAEETTNTQTLLSILLALGLDEDEWPQSLKPEVIAFRREIHRLPGMKEAIARRREEIVNQVTSFLQANHFLGNPWTRFQINDETLLVSLDLNRTPVSDISALRELVNLQVLSLDLTNVRDISALRDLVNLRMLNLNRTAVSDISALRDLVNLQDLSLAETRVRDISPLRDLVNLQNLNLGETQVSDISALSQLANLMVLRLNVTPVSDESIYELFRNPANPSQIRHPEWRDLVVLASDNRDIRWEGTPENGQPVKGASLGAEENFDKQIRDQVKEILRANAISLDYASINELQIYPKSRQVSLFLMRTPLEDKGLKDISRIPYLWELDLANTRVSDPSALAGVSTLEWVNFARTKVSDEAVKTLFRDPTNPEKLRHPEWMKLRVELKDGKSEMVWKGTPEKGEPVIQARSLGASETAAKIAKGKARDAEILQFIREWRKSEKKFDELGFPPEFGADLFAKRIADVKPITKLDEMLIKSALARLKVLTDFKELKEGKESPSPKAIREFMRAVESYPDDEKKALLEAISTRQDLGDLSRTAIQNFIRQLDERQANRAAREKALAWNQRAEAWSRTVDRFRAMAVSIRAGVFWVVLSVLQPQILRPVAAAFAVAGSVYLIPYLYSALAKKWNVPAPQKPVPQIEMPTEKMIPETPAPVTTDAGTAAVITAREPVAPQGFDPMELIIDRVSEVYTLDGQLDKLIEIDHQTGTRIILDGIADITSGWITVDSRTDEGLIGQTSQWDKDGNIQSRRFYRYGNSQAGPGQPLQFEFSGIDEIIFNPDGMPSVFRSYDSSYQLTNETPATPEMLENQFVGGVKGPFERVAPLPKYEPLPPAAPERQEYQYDDRDLMLRKIILWGGDIQRSEKILDKRGDIIFQKDFDGDGRLLRQFRVNHKRYSGDITQVLEFDSEGRLNQILILPPESKAVEGRSLGAYDEEAVRKILIGVRVAEPTDSAIEEARKFALGFANQAEGVTASNETWLGLGITVVSRLITVDNKKGKSPVNEGSKALADIIGNSKVPVWVRLNVADRIPSIRESIKIKNFMGAPLNTGVQLAIQSFKKDAGVPPLERKYSLEVLKETRRLERYRDEVGQVFLHAPDRLKSGRYYDEYFVNGVLDVLRESYSDPYISDSILMDIARYPDTSMDVKGLVMDRLSENLESALRYSQTEIKDQRRVQHILNFLDPLRRVVERNFANVLQGKSTNTEVLELLTRVTKESLHPLGFLVLKKYAGKPDLLEEVVRNESIDIRLRLYAFGLLVSKHNRFVTNKKFNDDTTAFLNEIVVDKNKTDEVSANAISKLLTSPFGREELTVINLAVLLTIRNRVGGIFENMDVLKNQLKRQMDSKIVRGLDNAFSSHQYGSVILKRAGGAGFLMIAAHELMHNALFSDFGLNTEGIHRASIHEFMSDLLAFALAEQMAWPADSFIKEMKIQKDYQRVRSRNWRSVEEHEAARAIIWHIHQHREKDGELSVRWNDLFTQGLSAVAVEKNDFNVLTQATLSIQLRGKTNPAPLPLELVAKEAKTGKAVIARSLGAGETSSDVPVMPSVSTPARVWYQPAVDWWKNFRARWSPAPAPEKPIPDFREAEQKIKDQGYVVVGESKDPDLRQQLYNFTGIPAIAWDEANGVYSPTAQGISFDFAGAIAEYMKALPPEKKQSGSPLRVLVIGSGTGLDALTAAHQAEANGLASDITATEILDSALANTQFNMQLAGKSVETHKVGPGRAGVEVFVGQMRAKEGWKPYDLILFNAPDATPVERLKAGETNTQMSETDLREILAASRALLAPDGVFLLRNLRELMSYGAIPKDYDVAALDLVSVGEKTHRVFQLTAKAASLGEGPGFYLRQELSLKQEAAVKTLLGINIFDETMIPDSKKGIKALLEADRILKERNAVGIVVGSLSRSLWNSAITEEQLDVHGDVDVVVLTPDFKLNQRFEGGIDWFLPFVDSFILDSQLEAAHPKKQIVRYWLNGNGVFIRSGFISDLSGITAGLYLPSRESLIELSKQTALASVNIEKIHFKRNNNPVIEAFHQALDDDMPRGLSSAWKDHFSGSERILEESKLKVSSNDPKIFRMLQKKFSDVGARRYKDMLVESVNRKPESDEETGVFNMSPKDVELLRKELEELQSAKKDLSEKLIGSERKLAVLDKEIPEIIIPEEKIVPLLQFNLTSDLISPYARMNKKLWIYDNNNCVVMQFDKVGGLKRVFLTRGWRSSHVDIKIIEILKSRGIPIVYLEDAGFSSFYITGLNGDFVGFSEEFVFNIDAEGKAGKIFTGTESRKNYTDFLNKMKAVGFKIFSLGKGFDFGRVIKVWQGADGGIWIQKFYGLSNYNDNTFWYVNAKGRLEIIVTKDKETSSYPDRNGGYHHETSYRIDGLSRIYRKKINSGQIQIYSAWNSDIPAEIKRNIELGESSVESRPTRVVKEGDIKVVIDNYSRVIERSLLNGKVLRVYTGRHDLETKGRDLVSYLEQNIPIVPLGYGLDQPESLKVEKNGHLFIMSDNQIIYELDSSGKLQNVFCEPWQVSAIVNGKKLKEKIVAEQAEQRKPIVMARLDEKNSLAILNAQIAELQRILDLSAKGFPLSDRQAGVNKLVEGASLGQFQLEEQKIRDAGYEIIGGSKDPDLAQQLFSFTEIPAIGWDFEGGVYSPTAQGISFDFAGAIAEYMKALPPEKKQSGSPLRVLVIGSGTGLDALTAAHQAKANGLASEITATEILDSALANTQFNMKLAGKSVETHKVDAGDEGVKAFADQLRAKEGWKPYDLILFNAPDATPDERLEAGATNTQMSETDLREILAASRALLAADGVFLLRNLTGLASRGVIPDGYEKESFNLFSAGQENHMVFKLTKTTAKAASLGSSGDVAARAAERKAAMLERSVPEMSATFAKKVGSGEVMSPKELFGEDVKLMTDEEMLAMGKDFLAKVWPNRAMLGAYTEFPANRRNIIAWLDLVNRTRSRWYRNEMTAGEIYSGNYEIEDISPEGEMAWAELASHKWAIVNPRTGKPLNKIRFRDPGPFSPDGETVWAQLVRNKWAIVNSRTGQPVNERRFRNRDSFSPDGEMVWAELADGWAIVNPRTGDPVNERRFQRGDSFSPDGEMVWALLADNGWAIINPRTGDPVNERRFQWGGSFSPDGEMVWAELADGWAIVNPRTGDPVNERRFQWGGSFSPDGEIVWAGLAENEWAIVNPRMGDPVNERRFQWGGSFSPDGEMVWARLAENEWAIVNPRTGESVNERKFMWASSFSPDGSMILDHGFDSRSKILYRIPKPKYLAPEFAPLVVTAHGASLGQYQPDELQFLASELGFGVFDGKRADIIATLMSKINADNIETLGEALYQHILTEIPKLFEKTLDSRLRGNDNTVRQLIMQSKQRLSESDALQVADQLLNQPAFENLTGKPEIKSKLVKAFTAIVQGASAEIVEAGVEVEESQRAAAVDLFSRNFPDENARKSIESIALQKLAESGKDLMAPSDKFQIVAHIGISSPLEKGAELVVGSAFAAVPERSSLNFDVLYTKNNTERVNAMRSYIEDLRRKLPEFAAKIRMKSSDQKDLIRAFQGYQKRLARTKDQYLIYIVPDVQMVADLREAPVIVMSDEDIPEELSFVKGFVSQAAVGLAKALKLPESDARRQKYLAYLAESGITYTKDPQTDKILFSINLQTFVQHLVDLQKAQAAIARAA